MLRSLVIAGRQAPQQTRSFAVFRMCEPFNYRDFDEPESQDPEMDEQFWTRDVLDVEFTRAETRHRRMIVENGLDVRPGKDDRNVKPTDQRRITKSNYEYGVEKRNRFKVLNFCLAQRIRERELLPRAAGFTQKQELEQLEKDKEYVLRALKEELKKSKKKMMNSK